MSSISTLFCALTCAASSFAADLWRVDFEKGADLKAYAAHLRFYPGSRVVPGGPAGKGHCLAVESAKPVQSVGVRVKGPIRVRRNLVLSFWHREEVEPGFQGAYLGMIFYVNGKQWFWSFDKFSTQWRQAHIRFSRLAPWRGHEVRAGLEFSGVQLYARVKDKPGKSRKTFARIRVWFDDIRLHVGAPAPAVGPLRVSLSNPPFFNWKLLPGERSVRIEYSRDPKFPAGRTVAASVQTNFYTPPRPVEPGLYYWRAWTRTKLDEGWAVAGRVEVPAEAHRFVTAPVSEVAVARLPRPRLLPYARIAEPDLAKRSPGDLKRLARRYYREGVPKHPGPWVKGDPRWPTWIEWYGKVAGRITGGTGRRLERLAYCAMLTRDPEIIQWTKELALKACEWDPNGGSHMRRGDIGAHHLLRGLCACYDACRGHMTPAERDTLKRIIVERTNQFYHHLNPFRGTAENNHAWLQTFGVGMAGLALMGDHDEAWDWAEYARQLYLGRFLCCLGYQGDNNEGLSYWSYGLSFIVQYADMMRAVCGIDLYRHPWLRQTDRFPLYCAPPGAWAVSFADTGMPNHGMRGPAAVGWVRRLALRVGDPYALWYAGAQDPSGKLAPRPPVDLPQSIHYRFIGWAVFNTSLVEGRAGVTVAMHSGKYYAGHQHPDQNHFVIHAYGDKLAIDGGYYDWYGSPHFKAYSSNTLAHNTLLVDGQGQAARRRGADGRIVDYFDSSTYGYVVGDASDPDIYGGKLKRFDRRILFVKPGFVVVHDLVAPAGKSAKLDWMLHAVSPIKIDAKTGAFDVARETAALRGRVLSPTGARLRVHTGFPVEPVNRYSTQPVPKDKYFPEWVLYASCDASPGGVEYFVPMQVQRLGEIETPRARIEPLPCEQGHAVRLTVGDAAHLVASRAIGAKRVLRAGKLETDGDMAAIEVSRDGRVRRCFAARATFLRYAGKTLLRSPARRDMEWHDRPELRSGPLKPGRVTVNGKPTALNGYQMRVGNDVIRYWWANVELAGSDRYTIQLDGWRGPGKPFVRLAQRPLDLDPRARRPFSTWLNKGTYMLVVAGRGALAGVRFDGLSVKAAAARMLPRDYRPRPGGIVVEAEKPSAEGPVRGRIMKKVGASRGRAHCCWDTEGQWAEWTFRIPKAGAYELLVRGASVYDTILRELKLDGKPLTPGIVRFTGTGGWCRDTNDWRYFRITSTDGRPLRVRLAAGKHTLRMEQRGGSMNVDCFVWEPAR